MKPVTKMQKKHDEIKYLKLKSHVTNLGENKRHKLAGTDKNAQTKKSSHAARQMCQPT